MLAALTGRDLVDTAVVVVRWFGGTKLGVGGLVRAYGGTAAATLDQGQFDEWVHRSTISFEHTPSETGVIERALSQAGATEVNVTWGTSIERTVQLPTDAVDDLWGALANVTNGRLRPPD